MPPVSQQPPEPTSPQQRPGAVFGTPYSTLPTPTTPVAPLPLGRKGKKHLLGLIVLAVLLVLGASAGAYFGYILPNDPDRLWTAALGNTAKGYDKLISYADEQKQHKGFKAEGTFKLEGAAVADGTFDITADNQNSLANFSIGVAGTRLGLETRVIKAANADLPDIYLKATGLKGVDDLLGTSSTGGIAQAVEAFDDQWIVIDHTAFEQLESQVTEPGAPQLSRDDIIAIAQAIGEVNRDYLWTDSPNKAVLRVAQDIGKEDRQGRSVHHYKAGYHKEHLKAYVTALKDKLKQTKLAEIAPDKNLENMLRHEDLLKSIDKLKGDGTADVWVDTETKLIRAVRFADNAHPDDFLEFGLNYNGGDDFPFVLTIKSIQDNKSTVEGTLTTTLNTKNDTVKVDLRASFDPGKARKTVFTLTATARPHNQAIEATAPEGAKPWLEVLGGPLSSYGPRPLIPTETQ